MALCSDEYLTALPRILATVPSTASLDGQHWGQFRSNSFLHRKALGGQYAAKGFQCGPGGNSYMPLVGLLAALNAGEIEHIIHQVRQPVAFPRSNLFRVV